MFKIYIKDFNQNGNVVSTETLVEEIPAKSEGDLKFINPIVKAEMGNVEGFDFSIQAGSKFYDAFLQMKTYIRVVYDGTTIFYGRVLTIDNSPFKGTRKVRCEGPLSFLMDSPVEGKEESARAKISVHDYMVNLINNHNNYVNNEANKRFKLGEVPGNYSDSIVTDQRISNGSQKFGSDSWTDTKAALEDLRSHFGGYFRIRAGKLGNKLTLDWMNHYFNNTVLDQVVEVGKNILDITDVTEVENIFTAIIPVGRTTATKSENGSTTSKQNNLYIDGKILKVPDITTNGQFSDAQLNRGYHSKSDYANAINNYGMIIKTVSLPDCTNVTKLYNEACKWILNNYQGKVTKFTVKAIDMHQIGKDVKKISVGDRVKLIYPVGQEDGTFIKKSIVQTCLSIQYDLYHPENNSYTFGIPANVLTKTYGLTKQKGSVNTPPENKPKPPSYPSNNQPKWINLVIDWLMEHNFYYSSSSPSGPMPYKPEYDSNGIGEKFMSGFKLFRAGSGGWLINAKNMLPKKDTSTTIVTEEALIKNNVLTWVLHQYGIDLRTYFEGVSPDPIKSELDAQTGDVGSSIVGGFLDGLTGGLNWYKITIGKTIQDVAGLFGQSLLGFFNFNDPDNPVPLAAVDPEGNFKWTYIDPDTGQLVGTNSRDLAIKTVHSDNFIGTVVEDNYFDENGNTHVYKFGQAIEDWADSDGSNSKLVVAHVDGDVIRIGSERTKFSTTVATNINGTFLSPIEFIVGTNPLTGESSAIHTGAAGQVSYKARWDDTKGCYVYDPNGDTILTGDGFWDTKNLAIKGGIYTVVEGTGDNKKYVSYVKSDRLVIGDQNTSTTILSALQTAGVINGNFDPQALVARSVYAEGINALTVRCDEIDTKKLNTDDLAARLARLDTVTVKNLFQTDSNSYVSAYAYKMADETQLYKKFTINFGTKIANDFIASSYSPGSGISMKYWNIGLTATELTGADAGKIKISFTDAWPNQDATGTGGTSDGGAVFKIAATKAYKDGVAASWNSARSSTSIPTNAIDLSQLSDSAMNNLQVKFPKAYSEYNSSSGDNRFIFYNYSMEFGTFTRQGASTQTAIILKSLTSNNIVAAYNITTDWNNRYTSGWNNCRNLIGYPTTDIGSVASSATKTITITIPKENGVESTDPYNYTMSLTSVKPTGSTTTIKCIDLENTNTNHIVGRLDINKAWNDRRQEGVDSVKLGSKSKTIAAGADVTFKASDDGLDGYSSIKVSAGSSTHQAPYGSAIGANSIVTSGSIYADGKSSSFTLSKTTFRPTGSTANVSCVELKLNGTIIGRVDYY